MKRFARALVVVLGLVALGSVVSLVPQKKASAQDAGPTVSIGSSIPLTVKGTVGAQQTGNWSVGISGTPTVNANVTFPTSLLIHNLDDRGRIPYQSVLDMSGQCPGNICEFDSALIPQGRRLVLEHVSGAFVFSGNATSFGVGVAPGPVTTQPPSSGFSLPVSGSSSVFDQNILLYFDGGQFVIVQVAVTGTQFLGNGAQIITLTGYLLDCSVAPCAAIAH